MSDFRMGFDVVGASYGSLPGVVAKLPPFHPLGGRTRAGYMFGTGYAEFNPDPIGRVLGPRADWTGGQRHLTQLGLRDMSDWWMICGTGTESPKTPFSVSALELDVAKGILLVCFHWCDPLARAINLIRAVNDGGSSDEETTIALLPNSPSTPGAEGTVRATAEESASPHSSSLTPLIHERDAVTMYAGHFRDTDRTIFTRAPGQALRSGSTEPTDVDISQSDGFYMGIETGSGSGLNRMLGCCYIHAEPASLADDLALLVAQQALFQQAVGSGLTMPG